MPKFPNPQLALLNRKIIFSSFVQYGGKAAQIILAWASLKTISNFLSANNFGLFAQISEYALFFSVVANLGIFGNVVRKMADAPTNGKIFVGALFARIFSAAAIFFFALAWLFLGGYEKVFIFGSAIFLLALFFDYITSVCDAALQANYLMGRATVALVLGRLINFGAILFLVKKAINWSLGEESLWMPVWFFGAAFLGIFCTAGLSFYLVKKKIRLIWQIDWKLIKYLLVSGLVFGAINIINNLYFRFLPDFLAGKILTQAQFGSFNIYFRITQTIALFSTFLMFSVLPGLKQLIDGRHLEKARELYFKVKRILVWSGAAVLFFGFFIGPKMVVILTHGRYVVADFVPVLFLMLLLSAVSFGYDLVLIGLFSFEKEDWFLKKEFISLTVAVLVFAPIYFEMVNLNSIWQICWVLSGSILAEGFMVAVGINKLEKELGSGF